MYAEIIGYGYALPKRSVDNDELTRLVATSDEWIQTRTGISSRYVSETENTSDLGAQAALAAIQDAHMQKEQIDLILCATFTPDHAAPSTACLIQAKLGLNEAPVMAFDINAACSGFLYALRCADAYIQSGMASHVLVIGAEVISKHLDWQDRSTCIIFADGAGAAVVTNTADHQKLFHYARSKGDTNKTIYTDGVPLGPALQNQKPQSSYVHMNGSATFRFAVSAMQESMEAVLAQASKTISQIDYVVPHQANIRIIHHVMKKMDIAEQQVFTNIDTIGNTSAASIPIALGQMRQQGLLKQGTQLVLSGFGAGFTWAGCYIEQ